MSESRPASYTSLVIDTQCSFLLFFGFVLRIFWKFCSSVNSTLYIYIILYYIYEKLENTKNWDFQIKNPSMIVGIVIEFSIAIIFIFFKIKLTRFLYFRLAVVGRKKNPRILEFFLNFNILLISKFWLNLLVDGPHFDYITKLNPTKSNIKKYTHTSLLHSKQHSMTKRDCNTCS